MISLSHKLIPTLVCLCVSLSQSAQINLHGTSDVHNVTRPSSQRGQEIFITDIALARDDGAGRYGQVVKNFRRADNPLHCVVTLSRAEEGTRVRFVWTAVAAGDKRDETLAEGEVVTKAREIVADGTLRLPREWPAGRYRVQATVNERVRKAVEFTIN